MESSKLRVYDETAEAYHRRYRHIQLKKYTALISYLREGPVVDVGVGTGIGLPVLLSIRPVVGIDGSIGMLRIAQRQIRDKLAPLDIPLICASASALPIRSRAVPTVVCITVLQNLPNPILGLGELLRIAIPGGLVGVTALSKTLSLRHLESHTVGRAEIVDRLHSLSNEDDGLILKVLECR